MKYFLLFVFYFIGHGTYFSALSPYTHTNFGSRAYLVILAGQLCFPVGYFLSGILSDRTRRLRSILVPALVLHGPVQYLLFSFPDSFALTVALSAVARLLFAANFQMITIAVLEGAGVLRFGSYRVAGTYSFFLIHLILFLIESSASAGRTPGTGLLADPRLGSVAGPIGLCAMWATALVATRVQRLRKSEATYYFRDAVAILKRPAVSVFFGFSFLFFFGYQLVDFHLGQWLKDRGGMRDVYLAWCLAVVIEIPFLPLAGRIARRFGIHALFYISLASALLRFGYLAAVTAGWALPSPVYSQLLHGLHFGGFYMGALFSLRAYFPEHLFGTGNGLYTVLCAALGGIAGNTLYGNLLYLGGSADFFPLFFSAMLLQVALIFGFLFLPAPVQRSGIHETS